MTVDKYIKKKNYQTTRCEGEERLEKNSKR